ncbi:hypothetical protein Tco_0628786 [Tanacetum coccineum]|uniref:Uncharacterized protein n=1 Tax=Tanacetum coccineum TaxID=301880 RepID=A0ABQ4WRB2_9ASTR
MVMSSSHTDGLDYLYNIQHRLAISFVITVHWHWYMGAKEQLGGKLGHHSIENAFTKIDGDTFEEVKTFGSITTGYADREQTFFQDEDGGVIYVFHQGLGSEERIFELLVIGNLRLLSSTHSRYFVTGLWYPGPSYGF